MIRRRILNKKQSQFIPPQEPILLTFGGGEGSDLYPIANGVLIECFAKSDGTGGSNWLCYKIYDSDKNVIKNVSWVSSVTIYPDDGTYFSVRNGGPSAIRYIKITWL